MMEHIRLIGDLDRFETVAHALIDHGFSDFLLESKLLPKISWFDSLLLSKTKQGSVGERLRKVAETLGSSTVLLAHYLSWRMDLVPYHVAKELEKATIKTTATFQDIPHLLRKKYNLKADSFKESALFIQANGSHNGTNVCVTLRKTGVDKQLKRDIAVLQSIALAAKENQATHHIDFEQVLKDFSQYADEMMNLSTHAKRLGSLKSLHLTRAQRLHPESKYHIITTPKIFESNPALLVVECDGLSITDVKPVLKSKVKSHIMLESVSHSLFVQAFVEGTFLSHLENIKIRDDGTLYVDEPTWAVTLAPAKRILLADIVLHTITKNAQSIVDSIVASVDKDKPIHANQHGALLAIRKVLQKHSHVATKVHSILIAAKEHGVIAPKEFFQFASTFTAIEHLAFAYDPTYDEFKHARPALAFLAKHRLHIHEEEKPMVSEEFTELSHQQHASLDRLSKEISVASSRISHSLLMTAFLVAGSLLLRNENENVVLFIAVPFFLLAFVVALLYVRSTSRQ
ncbi:MAG TPA: AarF/UbiB family protein [Acidobacteriota bacterium]|nr:AarF/UbiB family protein [Acidobacteriota bacterium]